ncbi:MAG: 4Fe-4S dicluster domain-containing protein [Lachnospiraceae bacterium]|nr:4Fe-4S dicluster domain-containing protein [Lachnospiraceae bacterium]
MIYSDFQDKKLSLLGFGAMRLPTREDGSVDEELVRDMTKYAMDKGVNYFDTAFPYHGGHSEVVMGKVLGEYPRDSYYLATKYPGHQISSSYNPAEIFEEQLRKCGVDYFDFYLLHNVYENSIDVYLDPKWGIIDYFKEQKRLGRIKHLGFSTHAKLKGLEQFLDACGEDMEFCQIQLNYLDWTLQDAKGKYELLTERGIPVFVMEPVRGGKLASLDAENETRLKSLRPDESIPAWGFRFLQGLPNVKMVLSGMSNMEQMVDNVKTFTEEKSLSVQETDLILEIAEGMKNSIPCTACKYCTSGCPMGLDIPGLIATYNEIRFAPVVNSVMHLQAMSDDKQPSACIACGKCSQICPQGIDIPQVMKDFTEALDKIPKWADICRQREEEAKKMMK